MFNVTRKSSVKAFTLLELIVVLVVLGILSALAIPTFAMVKTNSHKRIVTSNAEALVRDAKAIYMQSNGVLGISKSSIESAAAEMPSAIPDATVPNETKFTFTSGDQSASVYVATGSITIETVQSTALTFVDLSGMMNDGIYANSATWSSNYPVLYLEDKVNTAGQRIRFYQFTTVASATNPANSWQTCQSILNTYTNGYSVSRSLNQYSSDPSVGSGGVLVNAISSCTVTR